MKKTLSILLLLAMLASLFAGLTVTAEAAQPTSAADVNYVTSGKYVYNWGKRDTTATFLTTYAQQYYTGDYTYAKLSALSGNSGSGTAFYSSDMGTAIHNMLVAKQNYTTSYEAVKTLFQYTECEESSKTQISSYYSGASMGSTWGNGWNREHTWPNSKGLNGQDENDVLMLKPTLVSENSTRGNTAYGNSLYDPNENGQQLHGDVARMMLQHLMRWGNTNYFYGSGGVMESRAVLLEWMEEDPVDTWEMGRNDAVQQITGVRNVFVDYPELGFLLLGENVPANYPTPSQSGGTVVPAQEYTVTYSVPSGVTRPASVTASRVTLPTPTGTPTGDYTYTFRGWVEASVDNETAKPASIHEAGEQLALSEDTTLYALYSYTVGGTGGSSSLFNKITTEGELADGASYVFVSTVTGKALSQDVRSNWAYPGGTYNGNTIESPTATDVWTVSGGVISCANGNLYTSAAKAISLSSSTTNWTFTVSGGVWTIAAGNNVLSFNSTGWRPYSGGYGSDKTFYIYKAGAGGGTMYFTTVIGTQCNHTYTTVVTAPTCTTDGYTTYTCSKCGYSYTGNETTALGHNYGSFSHNANSDPSTHSKTCSRCHDVITESCTFTHSTVGTTTTHTCSVCRYSYSTTLDTYTVTFSVPAGVPAISAETVSEDMAMTLPTAGSVEGYTFCGWVTDAISSETAVIPSILNGSFMPDRDITLYALYARSDESSSGSSDEFAKVTSAPSDWSGDYLIVWEAGDNDARIFNGEDGTEKFATGTIVNNKIAPSDDYAVVTIEQMEGGYSLYVDGKGYMKGTSGSNALSYATSAQLNTIEMDDDGVLITSNTSVLRWNNGNTNGHMFRYYKTTSYGNQQPIQLYKKGAGTTYYTTNPVTETPCMHENTTLILEIAPTCTEPGYTGDIYCADCGVLLVVGEGVNPLGHSYDGSGVCENCGDKLISIDSASLRLDEDIDVIYTAKIPDGATSVFMTFTMNERTVRVGDNGNHEFIFERVNPQCMGDNISATLNVTYGGRSYSCTKASYSVKEYCTNLLSKSSTTTKLRKLLSDTLAYGAAAQTYMSYKTNALVTSDVTGTSYSTFAPLSGLAPTFSGTAAENPCWIGAGLCLTNNVEMVFRFYAENTSDLRVRISVNGETKTFDSSSFTAVSGMDNVYEVKLTGIKATDFGKTVSARFFKINTQVGNTVSYSVNTYICAKQNDSNTALKNLVRALYNYGDSAAAYAG